MEIAVTDDLQQEIASLKSVLMEYAAMHGITFSVHEFHSGEEFLQDYAPFSYTIIFLDIYMDGMTGIETAEKLRQMNDDTLIIFLTTSSDHRADAFSIHAYDYLEKPIRKDKLFRVMDDILKNRTTLYAKVLSFSVNRKDYLLPYPDIISVVTGDHNYLEIRDRHGNVFSPRMTFSTIAELLKQDSRFLQINRNILINMDHVADFQGGICCMKGGISFPVYTKKSKEVEQKWQNYMFSRIRKDNQERGFRL